MSMVVGTYQDDLSRDLDKVRVMIGDTDAAHNAFLLSDTHILAVLANEGTVNKAALFCANELLAQYAQQPTRATANGVIVDYTDRISAWRQVVATLQLNSNAATVPPASPISFVPVVYPGATAAADEWSKQR